MILPPLEKVIEAWTAIVDNRVAISPDSSWMQGHAEVKSSDGTKTYNLKWTDGGTLFRSDDNATYWRGYPGYPVIAVLMLQQRIPYDQTQAELFKDVNWTEVNKRFKGNYADAVAWVCEQKHIDISAALAAAREAYAAMAPMVLTVTRKKI